jgi:hypothetical protein
MTVLIDDAGRGHNEKLQPRQLALNPTADSRVSSPMTFSVFYNV